MSDKSNKIQSGSAPGKKGRIVPIVLSLTIIACIVALTFKGCDKPPKPPEAPPETTQNPEVSTPDTIEPEPSTMSDKQILNDTLAQMTPSESADFVRVILQNPDYTNIFNDGTAEAGNDEEPPKFFPMTEALKELIRLAEHALRMDLSDEEKLAALEELDGINHPDILEVVQAALLEGNAEVREAALDAIMDLNDPVVIPTVVKALDDEDPELREYALDALMDVDDPALNEAFSKALDDENLDVREAAADMMLFIESPNIIESLGKAMMDPNEDIRDMALITIEDIPDKRSVDILIQHGLLNDNETIREDALDSIEWITDKEFENYEDAREWWDANRENFEFDD